MSMTTGEKLFSFLAKKYELEAHANGKYISICVTLDEDAEESKNQYAFIHQSWSDFFAYLDQGDDFDDNEYKTMSRVLHKYADLCDSILEERGIKVKR